MVRGGEERAGGCIDLIMSRGLGLCCKLLNLSGSEPSRPQPGTMLEQTCGRSSERLNNRRNNVNI